MKGIDRASASIILLLHQFNHSAHRIVESTRVHFVSVDTWTPAETLNIIVNTKCSKFSMFLLRILVFWRHLCTMHHHNHHHRRPCHARKVQKMRPGFAITFWATNGATIWEPETGLWHWWSMITCHQKLWWWSFLTCHLYLKLNTRRVYHPLHWSLPTKQYITLTY